MAKGDSDFNPKDFSDKLDNLDAFKSEYEGANFYKKVQGAICESKLVEDAIKSVVWDVIKSKLIWILFTALGLIVTDLAIRSIPTILNAITEAAG